jgi:hypothetical protein
VIRTAGTIEEARIQLARLLNVFDKLEAKGIEGDATLAEAGHASDLLEGRGRGIVEADGDVQARPVCQVGGPIVEVVIGGGQDIAS